jgi:hypothetical protein
MFYCDPIHYDGFFCEIDITMHTLLGYQTIIPTLSELFRTSNLPACTVVYVHVRDEGDQHLFKKDILEGRFKPYSEDTLRG